MKQTLAGMFTYEMLVKKMTRVGLAKKLKISRSAVTQALEPSHNMTIGMADRIASALGMELRFYLVAKPKK